MKLIRNIALNLLIALMYLLGLFMLSLPLMIGADTFTRAGWVVCVGIPFIVAIPLILFTLDLDIYFKNKLKGYNCYISQFIMYIPFLVLDKINNLLIKKG